LIWRFEKILIAFDFLEIASEMPIEYLLNKRIGIARLTVGVDALSTLSRNRTLGRTRSRLRLRGREEKAAENAVGIIHEGDRFALKEGEYLVVDLDDRHKAG